ncbi:hypothetical protein ACJX0J_026519, partial [Zea mays]
IFLFSPLLTEANHLQSAIELGICTEAKIYRSIYDEASTTVADEKHFLLREWNNALEFVGLENEIVVYTFFCVHTYMYGLINDNAFLVNMIGTLFLTCFSLFEENTVIIEHMTEILFEPKPSVRSHRKG